MRFGHVSRRRLLELADGRLRAGTLPALDRAERHLAGCAECRARLERLRSSVARLDAWPVESPAPALDFERAAFHPKRHPARSRRFELALGGAAAAVLVVLVALWLALGPERLELREASAPPSRFESLALAEHAALRSTEPALALHSADADAIRAWLAEHGRFSADLLSTRPATGPRFAYLGAREAASGDLHAAAIALRIDGSAVTLLVGHASEVEGVPRWTPLGKRLQVRRDASGRHLLSWRNAGKAYTLVTDPGVSPKLACQLCHVQPRRLETIERVAGQL